MAKNKDKKNRGPTFKEAVAEAKAKQPAKKETASSANETPVWHIKNLQLDGDWGWTNIAPDDLRAVYAMLADLETKKWVDIQDRRNHVLSESSLSPEAKKQLEALELDDFMDAVITLRLTGKKRVVGLKDGRICRLLWWDPEHQVCPSNLKNT